MGVALSAWMGVALAVCENLLVNLLALLSHRR